MLQMLVRWIFFYHWHLKFQITEVEFLNPYIFYESRKSLDLSNFFTCNGCELNQICFSTDFFNDRHRTFHPLYRNSLSLNAFSFLSASYFLHLGLSFVPTFSIPWLCLLLQNIPYPCPFPVHPALFLRWIIACNHFTQKQLLPIQSHILAGVKLIQSLKLSLRSTPLT